MSSVTLDRKAALLSMFPDLRRVRRFARWPRVKGLEDKDRVVTVTGHLSLDRACEAYSETSEEVVAVPFGNYTRHGVFDLDRGSRYCHPLYFQLILAALESRKMQGHLLQSSASGGRWIMVTFPEPVLSVNLSRMLTAIIDSLGLHLGKGTCEVYPDEFNPFQCLRLPGLRSFGPVDPFTNETICTYSGEDGLQYVKMLFDTATSKLDMRTMPRSRKKSVTGSSVFKGELAFHAMPHRERIRQGETIYRNGIPEGLKRHEASLLVQAYLFQQYGREKGRREQQALLDEWITTKHNDRSKDWRDKKRQVLAEHGRMAHWSRKGDVRKRHNWNPKLANASKAKSKAAQHALCMASWLLSRLDRPVTYATLTELTGCSPTTIAKHREIWQKIVEKAPSRKNTNMEKIRMNTELEGTTDHNYQQEGSNESVRLFHEAERLGLRGPREIRLFLDLMVSPEGRGQDPKLMAAVVKNHFFEHETKQEGRFAESVRSVVIHSEPGVVDWVALYRNDDETREFPIEVVPVIHSEDPVKVGEILSRDLFRDTRVAVKSPAILTGPVLQEAPQTLITKLEKNTEEFEIASSNYLSKSLIGRPLSDQSRVRILEIVARVLKLNHPKLAARIRQEGTKVSLGAIPILKPNQYLSRGHRFESLSDVSITLGNVYLGMQRRIYRAYPEFSGPYRLEFQPVQEAA